MKATNTLELGAPTLSLDPAKTCALLLLLAATSAASGLERHPLRGHVPEAISRLGLQPIGRLPATNRLHLAIGLPLRNTNELARLLHDIYDPASPQFRHYLSSQQFTESFGPTKQDYEAVRRFAEAHGLEIVQQHGSRVVLSVAGQVSDIERAFNVRLRTYAHPKEARQFYAPDVEPSTDTGLSVLDISGLDNYVISRPMYHVKPYSAGAHPASGSGPNRLTRFKWQPTWHLRRGSPSPARSAARHSCYL